MIRTWLARLAVWCLKHGCGVQLSVEQVGIVRVTRYRWFGRLWVLREWV